MSDQQQFDTKQAKAAFHELVKAIARHQARLDMAEDLQRRREAKRQPVDNANSGDN